MDSFPLPICQRGRSYKCKLYQGKQFIGYCRSKRVQYYGLKENLIASEFRIICSFYITLVSKSDTQSFESQEAILLLAIRKKNLNRQYSPLLKQVIQSTRKIVETAISCVQHLFPKVISTKR